MNAYENAIRETYVFPAKSFGAAGETGGQLFRGPAGKRGLVRDILVSITEAMVGTTTVPEINVGSAVSALGTLKYEYARFRLGSAAGTGYLVNTTHRASYIARGDKSQPRAYEDFAGHVKLETDYIPADTDFAISWVEGVDGSETGAGDIYVWIDWF